MYPLLGVPVSYAGILSMIISFGTIVSSLNSDRLTRALGAGRVTAISVGMTAAALFGLTELPLWYFGFLLIVALLYMLLTTMVKVFYQKKYRELI